ncbi:MAG: AMP-binding protein, partial [Acidobacteria bacterium]|nr:AMP-binding protein [Acidobacteriota bacterium]
QVFLEHDAASQCASLKRVVCSGEALPSALVRRFAERLPHATLYNLYGPTEAAVDVTEWTCPKTDIPNAIPIGKPIANTQMYILDPYGAPVPVGVVGELYIAGVQVARGYLNRAELTAERFVKDPFSADEHARMYKTGDLARWQHDGNIEYLGRNDFQVKLRGFRIELGEIEARLVEHESIREVVVVAREDRAGDKRLVAYYTASEEIGDLRAFLGGRLPEYMVPSAFVQLEQMPLSPNGKLDRKALPAPDATVATRTYEPPQGEIETKLAALWQELLHVEQVGRHDNFFALGGHSLIAVPLMAKTAKQFGKVLPLASVFTAPTIAAMAELIARESDASSDILIPIQAHGDLPPFFAVPGAGGNVLSLRSLVGALGEKQPVFGLQGVGLDGKTQPFQSVGETAEANVRAMRGRQEAGPYRLIGYSYGGVVAHEMARILLDQGEDVSLVLLDSIAPAAQEFGDEEAGLLALMKEMTGGADLGLDVEVLKEYSDEQKAQYLAGLLNERDVVDVNAQQLASGMSVFRANIDSYRKHQPSKLPRAIDVSLYRASQTRERASVPHDYGWSDLFHGDVRIHDVDATHDSILANVRFTH